MSPSVSGRDNGYARGGRHMQHQGEGCRVQGIGVGCRVQGVGCKVQGARCRVQLACAVQAGADLMWAARWVRHLPMSPKSKSPQTITSKASTGASKPLYQARPRTVAFSDEPKRKAARHSPRFTPISCRAHVPHVGQSRPDSGFGFQCKASNPEGFSPSRSEAAKHPP